MEPAQLFHEIARGPAGGEAFWLTTDDGRRIRVGHWPVAEGAAVKGTVLLFPGRSEYIEKYGPIAQEMVGAGYHMVTIDWRGQGLSQRVCADRMTGHVEDYAEFQRDIAALMHFVEDRALPRPFHLIAHSMGGCIGLRALQAGLGISRAVFSAPMWGISMAALMRPVANVLSTVLAPSPWRCVRAPGTTRETYVLTAPFEDNQLTNSREMWAFMVEQARAHPELTLGGPSVAWLHASLVETRALMAMPAPETPCLTFLGTNERIVDPRPVRQMMESWQGGRLEMAPGAEHEIMMEGGALKALFVSKTLAHFDSAGS